MDKIEAQSQSLAQQLRKGLVDRGFRVFTPDGNHSSIVSFYTKKAPSDIQKMLDVERVKVSLQSNEAEERDTPMVRIRVAPAFFNNTAEVKRFLKVAEQLMKA